MAELDKRRVTLEELLECPASRKPRHWRNYLSKWPDHPRTVYAEDFGGTGDVSEVTEFHAAVNIGEMLIYCLR
jgi:hypothetical protein